MEAAKWRRPRQRTGARRRRHRHGIADRNHACGNRWPAELLAHIRSGSVKALAVDSEQRSPLFPAVPTLGELGFPNLAPVYFAFVAPAGTPKPIIQRLYEDISRIGNEPAFRKQRLIDIGIEPVFDTPEQFGRFLAEQRLNAARLIRESGLQPR
jgi:tripartite-type tricarboxylate transporter receptor subunit TctC